MSASKAETPKPEIKIENVVASVAVDQPINLRKILEKFHHAEYDPRRFPGLVFKLKDPKTAILIFGSGNMVITGAKAEKEAYRAVEKIIKSLESKGILKNPKVTVKIQNVVASGNLKGEIDLERAAEELEFAMYEPEEFPGLIYAMSDPKVVILLFASGKIVCTGARREEEVYRAVEKLKKELEEKGLIYYSE
ncbi:TATA box-binding protein [Candidatus Geothermarchaeota archaeon ex4572_27]|nr:MAG: TATA box-binding protein [Candidatus Geothermarchaeota archaeon ex4572_27]